MARNVGLFGRRELRAHERFLPGVTASIPVYRIIDTAGNKEWTVNVYLGPLTSDPAVNIIQNVPIAPYAKNLVTDIQQPVTIQRSKQGRWTVVGREKVLAAGAQAPEGTILEPTFHSIDYNLAALGLSFIADVDYFLEPLQTSPTTPLQAVPTEQLQNIAIYDAFGKHVFGEGAPIQIPLLDPAPDFTTTTRHTVLKMAQLGPPGNPDAMEFGVSELQPARPKIIEMVV